MHSTKSAITHHDVTVFEIDRMVTNIKIWISKERNMTFPRNEKILKFCFKDSTFRRHHFLRHHLLHKFWHIEHTDNSQNKRLVSVSFRLRCLKSNDLLLLELYAMSESAI